MQQDIHSSVKFMKSISFLPVICIFLTLFNMSAFSQSTVRTYDAQWNVIDGHISKGLPKSALEEVKKLYKLAKNDQQDAQIIKALLYSIDLQNENREDNELQSIRELEKEIAESRQPARSILTSILAEAYYNYYQQQRWVLFQRTQTADFKKDDIATWGIKDFHRKISELYLFSIQEEKLLQQTKLEPFDAIITKGNTRKLRPTLFDLLSFRALGYFSSDEHNIQKPSYAFEINTASAFDPAADFIHRKFETKDTSALEYKALLIYQKLIAFHSDDQQPDALIDADIHRLQFVKSKSVHPDADQLYYQAVYHLADQYASTPAAAQAWYLTAEWHQQKGETYNAREDTTNRFEKLKAIQICERVIKENPNTEGGINAFNLLNSIKRPSLQFSIETVNVPEVPFRVSVEYGNVTKLHLRLIKATETIKKYLKNTYDENFRTNVLSAAPIRTWQQSLPETRDFQKHSAEIKVDGLPVGEYFLIASTGENLRDANVIIGARLFYVSNISYLNPENHFFILNRSTGQPLAGAKVQLWDQRYDYKTSRYIKTKDTLYTTDKNGYFKKEIDKTEVFSKNYLLEISHKGDKLFQEDPLSQYYYKNANEGKPEVKIFLFSDRSIYRPGQTVFFKGIATYQNQVLNRPDQKINLVLKNANREDVSKIVLSANEYGTFSGKFQLPHGVLNGVFTLVADNKSMVTFRVEEYKRPKFYVEYEPVKKPYNVNDEIQISGNAVAYAGNSIDGATVKYRVVRTPRFIYPWFYKGWFPQTAPMEITHGETVTDKDGKFKVKFMAIPDLKINKKTEPIFDFVVYADVTDANGETRSGEKSVSVSYKSILLKLDIPESMPADSLKSLAIRSENTNGEFEQANVVIKIAMLKAEQRLIRPRYWERPDQFVMSKEDFIRNFPNDEYDSETDYKTWKKESLVFEKSGAVKAGQKFELKNTKPFLPGYYEIEITTKDKNGQEVKLISYAELTDQSQKLTRPQYLWTEASKPIEPGEKTAIKIGSSADNLSVISEVTKGKATKTSETFSFFPLNREKQILEYSATEADRGGYSVRYMFVKHNRVFRHAEVIEIPWTNKDLKIEYATFRDKTLPGSLEKWKVKITGYKKEKVASEMLASMYDASLDQFYPHNWAKPNLWPGFYSRNYWNGSVGFGFKQAEIRYDATAHYRSFKKQYDVLKDVSILAGISRALNGRVAGLALSKGSVVESAPDEEKNASVTAKKATVNYEIKKDEEVPEETQFESTKDSKPQIRTNFNETAFFIPDLHTNENGEIEFSFTMPEALTRWKFQALAHTKELAFGYSTKEIVTQKDLMVQPNAPRFLREGDQIDFSAKIANLTDRDLNGNVTFQLFDTENNKPLDDLFKNTVKELPFKVLARQSAAVKFKLEVPKNFAKTITWRIVAKAGAVSDGEENTLPVLPNRMLVTETLPLSMRGTGTKSFKIEKLIQSAKSTTLTNQSLTVEYTSNPVWYAIQSLPYLMEYPYDCAEQTWNRYYANAMAASIANSSPRIAKVFETWRTEDTTALLSNLQKNQELKSVLLEETPWVLAAKSEAEQKRNVGMLFDMVRMGREMGASLEKLKQMQSPNGGFVWFKGGPDDRYMTQYIVSGIGHLQKLKAIAPNQAEALNNILKTAIPYLDKKVRQDYDELTRQKVDLSKYTPNALVVQYLYMRSFFKDQKIETASQKAYDYFTDRSRKTWTTQNKYMQGMIALASHRAKDLVTAKAILKSLTETAVRHEELGMYWKSAQSWWWHENPIERQALLIEAFQEAGSDTKTVDDLRTWLLKSKQTNRWESTKATAEACYALLLQGTAWLEANPATTINLGSTTLKSSDVKQQAGTGYFKKTIEGEDITAAMGDIKVHITTADKGKVATSWGAVYWQYFEDLDKITFAETPLKLEKKLFIETNSDKGPVLTPVNEDDELAIGAKIKVRIVLRVDREMEYVHMKDMRASSLEPVNVLSGYKWQDGLGYYQSTKDASTNFFFNYLRKGTYVFEYPLFVTHGGDFSNGITTIQCMYAPEFTAHSEGVRVKVGK